MVERGPDHRLGIDRVVVIQDQDKALWEGGNLVEQRGQDRFGGWRLRGSEGGQHSCASVALIVWQRRNQIGRSESGRGRCPIRPAKARREPTLTPTPLPVGEGKIGRKSIR